jgi:peptide deformylase
MEELNLDNLTLIDFNDPLLRKKPEPFDFEKYDAQKVCEALFEKQKEFGGIGLSANQVGLDMKVFTMGDGDALKRFIINPELIDCSKETNVAKEGCLSLPGIFLNITRPAEATFKYQDVEGKECIEKYVDLAARVALHEYDHMLGFNYTMRASRLKLERALKAYNKKVKQTKRTVQAISQLPTEILEELEKQEQQPQEQANG